MTAAKLDCTDTEWLDAGLLHAPFCTMARRYPGRPALVCRDRFTTYGELRGRIVRSRTHLHQAGVRQGDRVAVVLPISADAVITLYAVLSLGAAYVPVDPCWPLPLQRELLGQLQPRALVADGCERLHLACLPSRVTAAQLARPACGEEEVPRVAAAPELSACVLWARGSAGALQGVQVSHRAARHVVDRACDELALGCGDRVAGLSSSCHGASLFELFAPLASGATLYLYDASNAAPPAPLARFLACQGITVLGAAPAMLALLVAGGRLDTQDLSRLRTVVLAGGRWPAGGFERLRAALPGHVTYHELCRSGETAPPCLPSDGPLPGSPMATLPVSRSNAATVERWDGLARLMEDGECGPPDGAPL